MKGFQSASICVNPWFRNSGDAYHNSLEQFVEFVGSIEFTGFIGSVGFVELEDSDE